MEVFQKITVQNKVAHLHSKKFYWAMYFSELSPHGHKESLLDWTGTSAEFSYLTPTAVTGSAWLFLNILEKNLQALFKERKPMCAIWMAFSALRQQCMTKSCSEPAMAHRASSNIVPKLGNTGSGASGIYQAF